MDICHIVPFFPYKEHMEEKVVEGGHLVGGVQKYVYEISKRLLRHNHNVTIISNKFTKETYNEIFNKYNIIRIKDPIKLYSSSIPLSLLHQFNPENYDIIHAHNSTPMFADIACYKNFKIKPFVLTYHADIVKKGTFGNIATSIYNNTSGKYLLNNSNRIIATTDSFAKNSRHLNKYLSKTIIIPCGVDVSLYNTNNINYIKTKYNLPQDAKILLFVGRLVELKGIDYLLKAVNRLIKKGTICYTVIVGSGPELQKLKLLTASLGLSSYVKFAGFVCSELPYYYSSCDIFIFPSISEESFGIVQLEAMASKKPIICTNIPGVNEVDKLGIASIHVPPKDYPALANAIEILLNDDALMKKMGDNGWNLVNTRYSWDSITNQIEQLYLDILRS